MSDKPTPRDYVSQTVIPALKLAGYTVTASGSLFFIQVIHVGYEETIRVCADDYGYKDCVALTPQGVWRVKPSKFVIDRATGTANLTGILATAKRLVKEARQRCEATRADRAARSAEKATYAANLPLCRALAADYSAELIDDGYSSTGAKVNILGLEVYPSQKHVEHVALKMDSRAYHVFHLSEADARAFIAAFIAMTKTEKE